MIVYKFASRSRPQKLIKAIKNIYSLSVDPFMILLTLDYDDVSVNNLKFRKALATFAKVYSVFGHSDNKIHAINRDLNLLPKQFDILINMSDDMEFQDVGFDKQIRRDFNNNYDQVLHYNDGNQKDRVMTMSIMGKMYFDRFGYIYHPSYHSLWCDCEATDVAKMLGKYTYMGDERILFKHLHPAFGLSEYDQQYKKTESPELWKKDEMTYHQRKQNKFELDVT